MRILLIVLLLVSASCSSKTINDGSLTTHDPIDQCELFYETRPHKKALNTVDPELIQASVDLPSDDVYQLTKSLLPLTSELLVKAEASYEGALEVHSQEIVQGGYEGITSSSVVLRLEVNSNAGYRALSDLAAQIGYLYVQDSTLVICEEVSTEGWIDTKSYELTDAVNSQPFWNEKNSALFFGLMIGASSAPDNIGYTYYPDTKVFLTLLGSDKEKEMIDSLVGWVESMSKGDIDIEASSRELKMLFPHNDWSRSPNGEAYQESLQSADALADLNEYRKRYIQTLRLAVNAL